MAYPQTIKRSSPTLAMALLGMTLLFAGLLALVVFLLLRPGVYGHEQITIYNQVPCCCAQRSEEHTSELQSRFDLVCRLLLEKKKNKYNMSSLILKIR